ncbi:hypothetical protein H6F89_33530 [Cyanobacteria bacterium FACHB-63]|nr:hypothetical protein [Cyanobacteria bacterium FACHB-63]
MDTKLANNWLTLASRSWMLSTIERPLPQTAMEETALDLMLSSEPPIPPITIEAWIILMFMAALVAWGLWSERQEKP